MEKVYAQLNHARWIVICPNCTQMGIISASEVKPGDVFICVEEHPDLMKNMLVPHPRTQGAFNSVPDDYAREEARQSALEAGECFEVVFPAEKPTIEAVLRERPVSARNWFPGVTVDELRVENEAMKQPPLIPVPDLSVQILDDDYQEPLEETPQEMDQ